MIRSVTTADPLWTDEDRNLLLALLAEEREECSGCRQPLEISTDRRTQGTWQVKRITCEACRILEAEIGNDHEAKRRARGRRYIVHRSD